MAWCERGGVAQVCRECTGSIPGVTEEKNGCFFVVFDYIKW